jgi:tRNA(Ile)-lysidine synthase
LSVDDVNIINSIRTQFHASPPARLGVAVSGGGDSMALLHALKQCFEPGQVELHAVTVNHGLRKDAESEAALVARLSDSLEISHTTLHWRGWDGAGNLQDQARRARYQLLTDWAKGQNIAVLALGHTADDQAETVLMRLARSSGVTGLSGMPARRTFAGVTLLRPMLGLTRDQLRDYLRAHNVRWVDDPSNDDRRFDRVKIRQTLKLLEPLGLTARTLSDVAENMAQARDALDWFSFLSARDLVFIKGGDVVMDLRQFRTVPDEIARRLLVRAVTWISGSDYGPRRSAVKHALDAIRLGKTITLGGCRIMRHESQIWVCREYNAVRELSKPADQLWDRRWRLSGPDAQLHVARPLGRHGLAECPNWRETGHPHAALTASPSVWQKDKLVAAPVAGLSQGWDAELLGGGEDFFASLLSH